MTAEQKYDQFDALKTIDKLWSEMNNVSSCSIKEITDVVKSEIARLSGSLSLSQFDDLSNSLLAKTKSESKKLLSDFINASDTNIWTLDKADRVNLLTRSLSIRCLEKGLLYLYKENAKLFDDEQDESRKDKYIYLSDLMTGIVHESISFVNPAQSLLYDCQSVPEAFEEKALSAFQKEIISSLNELVVFLGDDTSVLDLIDRTSVLMNGSSGKDFHSLSYAIKERFDSMGVAFNIVDESGLTYAETKGDGSKLYTIVKNIILNSLQENISSGSLDNVHVLMTLDKDQKNYILKCTNNGHFPDEWLNKGGKVVVFGQTTKKTGTGIGLQLIDDYTNMLGGKFCIRNKKGKVISTLIIPVKE